ncbi:MAG TPA: ATP-binding protein [Phycisphaerae bacterium]|nr:ATP-binding protein [Phycisphaerae bacterium]
MPTLYILQGPDKGRTFQTHDEAALVGRSADDIPLTDQTVSRRHACLRPENGAWFLEDLGSANGTYVNGVRITKPQSLKHGDQIRVGSTLLVYAGEESTSKLKPTSLPTGLVDLDAGSKQLDASIVSSMRSNEDSVIIAAPELAEATRSLHVMYELAQVIGSGVSTDRLLERVMDIIYDQVPVDRGFVLLVDANSGQMVPRFVRSRLPDEQEEHERIIASRKIIDHVVKRREAVLCTNAMTDQRFAEKKDGSIHSYGLRSVICAPISARDRVLGAIHIDCSMSAHTYNEEQLRLITSIGYMAGLAIENGRLLSARVQGERLAAVGEAVAYLSHYIKNILQGMRSGADVIELGLQRRNFTALERGWQVMYRNIDRIYNLSMNMLAFSKQRQPRIEQLQLNKVVQDVVDLAQRLADDRKAMLLFEPAESFPPIPLDPDGIHQVLLNIVTNAIEAVEPDSGIVNVKTHYDAANQQALITIGDNGPGIPEDQLHSIFQAFRSTKGHAGTGLGLAVAHKIIDEHGGRITVSSVVGEGTIFEIGLPIGQRRIFDSGDTHGPAS